jgi:hypothetical protein
MTELEDGPGVGIPFKYRRNAWLLTIALLLLGTKASFLWHDWGWLARSGALLTVAALSVGSFNSSLQAALVVDYLDNAHDPSQSIYEAMRAKPHLYGISRPLSELETREVVAKERNRLKARVRSVLESEMSSSLKQLELQVATLGTLVWGFGDLINKLIPLQAG